jgi:transposase-like protein
MKLTYEQKLEIYRERKEEFYSWSMLTLKWNCSRSVLDYMIKLMDCHGVEIVKHKYTDYPNQYKKEAINRVLIDDESIREVSIQLGLSNIGTLTRWIKEYKANGYNIIKKRLFINKCGYINQRIC